MCGRFALGNDARAHRNAIERWLASRDASRRGDEVDDDDEEGTRSRRDRGSASSRDRRRPRRGGRRQERDGGRRDEDGSHGDVGPLESAGSAPANAGGADEVGETRSQASTSEERPDSWARRADARDVSVDDDTDESGGGSSSSSDDDGDDVVGVPGDPPLVEASDDLESFRPSFNVAPHTLLPVMRRRTAEEAAGEGESRDDAAAHPKPGGGGGGEGGASSHLVLQLMRWGLLPRSTKSRPGYGEVLRTINARDDTLLSGGGLWWPIFQRHQRCVVWAQGFYEWQKRADGTRLAHFVGMRDEGPGRRDGQGKERALMPMAGLWEKCYLDGSSKPTYTFTIITTESNKQLSFLHDRMPVILPDVSSVLSWLGVHPRAARNSASSTARLLRPYPAGGGLDCYRVTNEVGKVGNDAPDFILPLHQRKGGILAAFGRAAAAAKKEEVVCAAGGEGQKADEGAGAPKRDEAPPETEMEAAAEARRAVATPTRAPSAPQGLRGAKRERDEGDEFDAPSASTSPSRRRGRKPSPGVGSNTDDCGPEVGRGGFGGGSSKWSPEPYDPPLSPPRPRGGYTRRARDDDGGGGAGFAPSSGSVGVVGSRTRRAGRDRVREWTPEGQASIQAMLHKQRQRAEAPPASPAQMEVGGGESGGKRGVGAATGEAKMGSPSSKRTKTTAAAATTTTTTRGGATAQRKAPAARDIRSFFAKS